MNFWYMISLSQLAGLLAAVALLLASFQLSASLLTNLSTHHLGFGRSHRTLLALCGAFLGGVLATLMMILLGLTYVLSGLTLEDRVLWAMITGYSAAVGLVALLFYYRPGPGTALWIPMGMNDFLQRLSSKTHTTAESFGLGVLGAIGELPFSLAPLLIAAELLRNLPPSYGLIFVAEFVLLAISPLLLIVGLVGGGHKLSRIQQWREANKAFLRLASGIGLIVVSGYLFVNNCLGP